MRYGDETSAHTHRVSAAGRTTVQPQLRWAPRANHLDVLPEHAPRVAGAESLHRRFFHGKAAGQVGNRISPARTVGDLRFGEDAVQEPISVPLERLGYPGQIRRIEPDSYGRHA